MEGHGWTAVPEIVGLSSVMLIAALYCCFKVYRTHPVDFSFLILGLIIVAEIGTIVE